MHAGSVGRGATRVTILPPGIPAGLDHLSKKKPAGRETGGLDCGVVEPLVPRGHQRLMLLLERFDQRRHMANSEDRAGDAFRRQIMPDDLAAVEIGLADYTMQRQFGDFRHLGKIGNFAFHLAQPV